MGLFSSKKKRFVETSVVRVIEDAMIPNMLDSAIIETIMSGGGITERIQDTALNGSFRGFERMYRHARVPGNYTYGLPDVEVRNSGEGFPLAVAEIESQMGGPIALEYMYFRPLNNVHAGYNWVTANWAYDEDTNTLARPGQAAGSTVYLEKLVALHDTATGQEPEANALGAFSNTEGFTPESPTLDGALAGNLSDLNVQQEIRVRPGPEAVEVHWFEDLNGVVTRGIETVDLTNYDEDREYYQAKYTFGGDTYYWIYDPTVGGNAALNSVFTPRAYVAPGTYFPFVVFRSEQVDRTADDTTPEFQSTKELLDKISMDFQEIGDGINQNPDIGDIRQAVLMLGVPITTDDQVQIEYLHTYFGDLHSRLPSTATQRRPTLGQLTDSLLGNDESYAIQISDADFAINISFDKVSIRLRAGSIGAVGTYQNSQDSLATTDTSIPGLTFTTTSPINTNKRFIRKQLTPGVYEEIEIVNPQFRYPVNETYGKSVEGGADDERLLIPLDYELCQQINVLKRERLYYTSFNFVFNSYVVQKVKWYETGIFKALLVVVAVVISFYLGPWAGAWAAAATATAAAMVILTFVLSFVLQSIIFEFVFTQIVEAVGVEVALLLAVVALVVGGAKALKVGEIVKNSSADLLLKAASGLGTGIQGATANELKDLTKQYELLETEREAMEEELETAQALLGNPLSLDPFAFIGQQPLVVFGESPEGYFDRTIHSGNVGVQSLNIIQNFVDISIRLPSVDESFGA